MLECKICVNLFNKTNHKKIMCECKECVCLECCKKYITESDSFANCMSCKKEWNRIFLFENFPKKWLNKEYKKHKEELLEKRHDAMLPKYHKYVLSKKREHEYQNEIKEIEKEIQSLYKKRHTLNLLAHKEYLFYSGYSNEPEKLNLPIGNCPKNECRGFIDKSLKCSICNIKVCSKCNNEESDFHVCNLENINSVDAIQKECKNCPSCISTIYKIDGCNEMFCTKCKVSFRWDTLDIITSGPRHNPHYTDYMSSINASKNYIEIYDLKPIHAKTKKDSNKIKKFQELLRKAFETQDYINDHLENVEDFNRELGIKYIEGCITNDERRDILQKKHKELEKQKDTNLIRELWTEQIKNNLYNFVHNGVSLDETSKNIDALQEYCNEVLKKIGVSYNSRIPELAISDL